MGGGAVAGRSEVSRANPARWRGHMARMLPKVRKEQGHHAAMDYQDVPAFLGQLSGRHSISADALRFLILTGARSGEVRGVPA